MATSRMDSSEIDALVAAVDLSAKEFCFVNVDTTGKLVVASNAGRTVGTVIEGSIAGKNTSYQTGGIAKVIAGATVAPGRNVMSDANGAAISATGAGSHIAGVALTGGAAGEVIEVSLQRNIVA